MAKTSLGSPLGSRCPFEVVGLLVGTSGRAGHWVGSGKQAEVCGALRWRA